MRTLTKKSQYGLRALLALARRWGQGPMLISELATQESIPKKFLELTLLELRHAGLLQSKKGKGGGYYLLRAPDKVTVGQVVRLLDGPLAPLPCARERDMVKCDECEDAATCGIRLVMREVRDVTAKVLDGTSLTAVNRRSDALAKEKRQPWSYEI